MMRTEEEDEKWTRAKAPEQKRNYGGERGPLPGMTIYRWNQSAPPLFNDFNYTASLSSSSLSTL